MTHPPEWPIGEPCPVCGSPDILECELRINADKIEMSWECRECGHSVTWTAPPGIDEGHMIERRIVEHMPLHAITALYGERGLRERFATETARLCDSAGRLKVKQALQLAGRLHSLDHRQREPYVNHLLRVALRIIVHYDVHDPDVICAALLHDTVEDHADDLSPAGRPGAYALLTASFGPRVADLVAAVTNPIYATGTDESTEYRAHVAASLESRRGRGYSRRPTSPITASALSIPPDRRPRSRPANTPHSFPSSPTSSPVRTRRSPVRPRHESFANSKAQTSASRPSPWRLPPHRKGGDPLLAVSISLITLLAVAVWALYKFGGLKVWHGLVCILFGFYLASSSVAPEIRSTLTSIIHALTGQS